MSIKEKSTFRKHELEYESPDSTKESPDLWDIVIVEHGDRKYIQYKRSADKEFITIDGQMLIDMADAYRKVISSTPIPKSTPVLKVPNIIDHRSIEKRGEEIQKSVDESMKNQDDSVEPIQSFSADYTEFRTGLKPEEAAQPVGETPEEWKINKEQMESLKKDVQKRVGAKDLI